MSDTLDLLLFSTDPVVIREADRAGIDGFVVDWEDRQRFEREHHADDLHSGMVFFHRHDGTLLWVRHVALHASRIWTWTGWSLSDQRQHS